MANTVEDLLRKLNRLNELGIALSSEKSYNALLEKIVRGAKEISNADGGSLYVLTDEKQLRFEIVMNDTLGIQFGQESSKSCHKNFPEIPLYHEDGKPNDHLVVVHAVVHDKIINIADVKDTKEFDFSGSIKFDERNNYKSKSFLTVPLKNHEGTIIGVMQLINALNPVTREVIPFGKEVSEMITSLASQAAIAMTNNYLLHQLENFIESIIEVLADAIDAKSAYTGEHCRRVPIITMMLADAVNSISSGPFKERHLTEKELYELHIAALLHDCGKVTTPVHVVDKSTKLETIFDRIHLIDTRFEVLKRDAEIAMLKGKIEEKEYKQILKQIEEDKEKLHRCNNTGEYMSEEQALSVREIGQKKWNFEGKELCFLSDNEIENLTIRKGTLTVGERKIINNHVVMSIQMLESLPFPKHLKQVPEIAGAHHERMDGKGYPRGIKMSSMSLQARMLSVADVFEALTARGRPYKAAMPLSQALKIMTSMSKEGHIDPEVFQIFVQEKVPLKYAKQYLTKEQCDVEDMHFLEG